MSLEAARNVHACCNRLHFQLYLNKLSHYFFKNHSHSPPAWCLFLQSSVCLSVIQLSKSLTWKVYFWYWRLNYEDTHIERLDWRYYHATMRPHCWLSHCFCAAVIVACIVRSQSFPHALRYAVLRRTLLASARTRWEEETATTSECKRGPASTNEHQIVSKSLTYHWTYYRSFRGRFYRPDDPTNSVKELKEAGWLLR